MKMQNVPNDATIDALHAISRHESHQTQGAAWYEPGQDFCFVAQAQETCRTTKGRLLKCKLTDGEWSCLSSIKTIDGILQRIKSLAEEEQKRRNQRPGSLKLFGNLTASFCEFAVRTSGVVKLLLPQSPEFTVTYGLFLLVFQAVVDRKRQQEALVEMVDKLAFKLPLLDFYQQVFPTNAMKIVVAELYIEILGFLEEAFLYYRNGRLSQLVDAFLQSGEDRLAARTERMTDLADKLRELREVGHIAQQSDMKELLTSTSHVVAKVYENMQSLTIAMGTTLSIISQRCNDIEATTMTMFECQATQYTQNLCAVLLPNHTDPDEDLERISRQNHRLSPKDHWESNGVLGEILSWSTSDRSSVLWVSGVCGNQDGWVTEFAVDLVSALQPQPVTVLFAFCNDSSPSPSSSSDTNANPLSDVDIDIDIDPTPPIITPQSILKLLLVQLLTYHPTLSYPSPFTSTTLLTPARLRRIITSHSFTSLFHLLSTLLSTLEQDVYIVIDRVEACGSADDVACVLLPALARLAARLDRASVVVTSLYPVPAAPLMGELAKEEDGSMGTGMEEEERGLGGVYSVYIDTAKKQARHRERWRS